MAQQNCWEETMNSENSLQGGNNLRSEDLSGELQGEPQGPQPTESKDDAEAVKYFWSIQGDFIYRHHNEPRVQHHVPKKKHSPLD